MFQITLLNNFNDLELFIELLVKNKQSYDILYAQHPWLDSFDNETDKITTKIAILSNYGPTYVALKVHKDDMESINTFLEINNATKLTAISVSNNSVKLNF